MSQLFSIGADYRMASATVRDMISVSADSVSAKLRQLTANGIASEAALVSTCNRTEVYCLTQRPEEVAQWLGGNANDSLFRLCAEDAVRRAFCVASGLESQILGENEITGQIKRAAQIARDSGTSGVLVNRLMEKSLAAAKAVRTQTNIGGHSMSYCGLAARAAAGIFADFNQLAVLFVGTGEMTHAGIPIFAGRGAKRIAVTSRTLAHAEQLAATADGDAFPLSQLPDIIGEFDVVISATASPIPIIGKGAVERALAYRRRRPMVFADLGVPHDLEHEIATLPDVFVYTLAQLGAQAEQSQRARQQAAHLSKDIINQHVEDFCLWWQKRTARQQEMSKG